MNDETAALRFSDVVKVFRDFWRREKVRAVDGVSLEVPRGRIYGLLGPNGSGKSTLMKIALGLLRPSSGFVAVLGRRPGDPRNKELLGYLPEETYTYRYHTAESALDFFGKLFGLPRAERRRRTDALLEMVGLNPARKRYLKEYSKGMARRMGLAQALIGDPVMLFLDEPTSGLDPIGTRQMKDLLLELKKRGKTIFMSSHLLADVEDVCDRIAIMYAGRIIAEGPVDELLEKKEEITFTMRLGEGIDPKEIASRLAEIAGSSPRIGRPRMRLEDYFLEVVREAGRRMEEKASVGRGGGTPEFLGGQESTEEERPQEERKKKVIERLLKGEEEG